MGTGLWFLCSADMPLSLLGGGSPGPLGLCRRDLALQLGVRKRALCGACGGRRKVRVVGDVVAGGACAWNRDGSSILSCGASDRQLGCRCCRNTFCLGWRRESLKRERGGRKVLKGDVRWMVVKCSG